jgi:hypothetical protein
MKFRTFLIIGVLLAFVALSIHAALRTPALLSTKEVKELVAKPESPEVHLKLARHFRALAALRETEADEYSAITEQYRASIPGWLNNPLLSNRVEDCSYLADSLWEAGKAARLHAAIWRPLRSS